MKKIFAFIMAVILAFSVLTVYASAEEAAEEIVVTCGHTDFIFAGDTPVEIQERFIAYYFGEEDDGTAACGILCDLLGHKLETTSTTTVTHKARATAPRCLQKTFLVETCTRCDYTNSTLTSSRYISCC